MIIPEKFLEVYNLYHKKVPLPRTFEISFLYDIRNNMILAVMRDETVCLEIKNLIKLIVNSDLIVVTMREENFIPKNNFWLYEITSEEINIAKFSSHFRSPAVEFIKTTANNVVNKLKVNDHILSTINKLIPLCEEISSLKSYKSNMLIEIDNVKFLYPELENLINQQENHSVLKDIDNIIERLTKQCLRINQ